MIIVRCNYWKRLKFLFDSAVLVQIGLAKILPHLYPHFLASIWNKFLKFHLDFSLLVAWDGNWKKYYYLHREQHLNVECSNYKIDCWAQVVTDRMILPKSSWPALVRFGGQKFPVRSLVIYWCSQARWVQGSNNLNQVNKRLSTLNVHTANDDVILI